MKNILLQVMLGLIPSTGYSHSPPSLPETVVFIAAGSTVLELSEYRVWLKIYRDTSDLSVWKVYYWYPWGSKYGVYGKAVRVTYTEPLQEELEVWRLEP